MLKLWDLAETSMWLAMIDHCGLRTAEAAEKYQRAIEKVHDLRCMAEKIHLQMRGYTFTEQEPTLLPV